MSQGQNPAQYIDQQRQSEQVNSQSSGELFSNQDILDGMLPSLALFVLASHKMCSDQTRLVGMMHVSSYDWCVSSFFDTIPRTREGTTTCIEAGRARARPGSPEGREAYCNGKSTRMDVDHLLQSFECPWWHGDGWRLLASPECSLSTQEYRVISSRRYCSFYA